MAAALIHTAQFPIADLERNIAELNQQFNTILYTRYTVAIDPTTTTFCLKNFAGPALLFVLQGYDELSDELQQQISAAMDNFSFDSQNRYIYFVIKFTKLTRTQQLKRRSKREPLRTIQVQPQIFPEPFQRDLNEKGYAILPNILSPEESKSMEAGFWDYWEYTTGNKILRHDESTWKNIHDFYPKHGMIFQHFSIGHMQAVWDLRSHPNILRVYETIWQTKNLTVSFDGVATSLAPEVTGKGWHRKDWFHLDQSPCRSNFECVQGWVTANEIGPRDATLSVLEGSHNLHAEFAKHFGLTDNAANKKDWYKLTDEEAEWYVSRGCRQINIECPAGSMVLWDSRTVHAGRGPLRGRREARNRIVAYISMMPQHFLMPKERKTKKMAVLTGRLTTHWAAGRVKLFPKFPRTYGASLPQTAEYQPPLLTPRGALLAGWEDYRNCPLILRDPEQRKAAIESELENMCKGSKRKRNATTSSSSE